MYNFLYYYLIFINCTAFAVYGADKAFAKLHSWRVPEIVLLSRENPTHPMNVSVPLAAR